MVGQGRAYGLRQIRDAACPLFGTRSLSPHHSRLPSRLASSLPSAPVHEPRWPQLDVALELESSTKVVSDASETTYLLRVNYPPSSLEFSTPSPRRYWRHSALCSIYALVDNRQFARARQDCIDSTVEPNALAFPSPRLATSPALAVFNISSSRSGRYEHDSAIPSYYARPELLTHLHGHLTFCIRTRQRPDSSPPRSQMARYRTNLHRLGNKRNSVRSVYRGIKKTCTYRMMCTLASRAIQLIDSEFHGRFAIDDVPIQAALAVYAGE
ncbi:hypothetical protein EXIGLDRAFT_777465 [Exidia glandulosa HHB12029]|uniref:Uncharacterized protein n=1 Tax=Exidia glandulosa HHB12029 TaxID=1314781 RepID=A0A165ZKH2_EXIGL|nr:hypothetical protein EXIGLDRAFT_777465 [Exidia glandulosa HHB12029]